MSQIAKLRSILGWSQEKLARAMDMSSKTVSNVEAGKAFNSDTVQALADGLHISLEKAFALCASTLGESELNSLAATITRATHDAAKGLPNANTRSREAPENETGRARRKAPRRAEHAVKT